MIVKKELLKLRDIDRLTLAAVKLGDVPHSFNDVAECHDALNRDTDAAVRKCESIVARNEYHCVTGDVVCADSGVGGNGRRWTVLCYTMKHDAVKSC